MLKRTAATGLWFLSMWFAGALGAYVFGLSDAFAPALATAAALFVGIDPRGLFWPKAVNPNPRVATRLASMATPGGAR